MPAQPPPLIITSTSTSQNSPRANCATITPTKEKKSQKPKIPGTLSTKKAVAKAKHSVVNNLVDDLANVVGFIFLQNARDQTEYKNCALAYYYRPPSFFIGSIR